MRLAVVNCLISPVAAALMCYSAVCLSVTGGGRVDATSEFGIVVTYRLGQLRMLMAAEIDAQQPGGAPGPEGGVPYVEMKTYK